MSLGISPFQSNLLYNRGITRPDQLESFLSPGPQDLHDPFLLPDMDRAVERLERAISSREVVGAFGDFDTDGIAGTALLFQALERLGLRVVPYIPHRVEEGHGLNVQAIKGLKEAGVSLLITVDCGITSVEEVDVASSLGMDTIITDHHSLPPALPSAHAIVNPHRPDSRYPFRDLAGVGLGFKLSQGLYQHLGHRWPEDLLELVALGTVADLSPLKGENRYLVMEGLRVINRTRRPGLQELIKGARLAPGAIDTEAISYGLAPRLNAAGRLEHAITSMRLLTATSRDEAALLARQLEQRNSQRQQLTRDALIEASSEVASRPEVEPLLIVGAEEWSPGILGLVAGKLAEEFCRPTIALSLGGDVIRASARSIPEFNIAEALGMCSDLFCRFGGHAQAAGFTMPSEHLNTLKQRLQAIAGERLSGLDLTPTINIDAQVPLQLLVGENFAFLQSLAPFGEGNPMPVFLTTNVQVVEASTMGDRSQHLRLKLKQGGSMWKGTAFWSSERLDHMQGKIDMVFTIAVDRWNSQNTLRLNLLDFRRSR